MKKYGLLLAFITLVSFSIYGKSEDTLSTKEIFRPQILPKGMWMLTANKDFNFNVVTTFKDDDGEIYVFNILTLIPAHSLSNRIMMPVFPLPFFNTRISKTDILDENKHWTKKPSIVLGFGISGFNCFRNDYSESHAYRIGLPLELSLTVKKLFSERVYYVGKISGLDYFLINPVENYAISFIYNSIGFQFNEKIYSTIGYSLRGMGLVKEVKLITIGHDVPIEVGFHINKNVTITINFDLYIAQHGKTYIQEVQFPLAVGFTCQW